MTVGELILILNKADANATVTTWNGFYDTKTEEVHVSKMRDGRILVMDCQIGDRL
jgi:hypothetical protein